MKQFFEIKIIIVLVLILNFLGKRKEWGNT